METKMDMLNGPLLKKILIFALPIICGSIMQQLFSAVDIAALGLTKDSIGQAAIGANTPLIALFINFFIGISVGINVVIGNYIGQNHKERISKTVHTAMLFSFLSGAVLFVVMQIIARFALTLMATPDNVIDSAIKYLRIYACGMPFILIYNFGAAVLRTVGDTKRPLYALMLSGIVNIILDVMLTCVFSFGVTGVAIATSFANFINAVLVCYFLTKEKTDIKLSFAKLSIESEDLLKILSIGFPAGLQAIVFSSANMCVQSGINEYGAHAIAGNSIALIFEVLSYYIVTGINQAAVTFTSVNFGARKKDRCKKVVIITMAAGFLLTNLVNYTFIIFEKYFVGIFTSDPAVADYAFLRFKVVLALQCLICSYEICGSVLRGLGHSLLPTILMIFGTCALRIVWINSICSRVNNIAYVFVVYPISWVITGFLVVLAFLIMWGRIWK